jgi:hypothetical protein
MVRKTAEPVLQATDSIWEGLPHLEGNIPDTDCGAARTENLIICHQYREWVHLGEGILHACIACVDFGCKMPQLGEEEV